MFRKSSDKSPTSRYSCICWGPYYSSRDPSICISSSQGLPMHARTQPNTNFLPHNILLGRPWCHASTSDTTAADVESARFCSDFAGGFSLAWLGVLMAIYSLAHAAITCSERWKPNFSDGVLDRHLSLRDWQVIFRRRSYLHFLDFFCSDRVGRKIWNVALRALFTAILKSPPESVGAGLRRRETSEKHPRFPQRESTTTRVLRLNNNVRCPIID